MEVTNDVIVGIWKFHERVGRKELLEVAEEWAKDENCSQVYIRKVSKDQLGIGVVCKYDGSKEGADAYMDKISDYLKRKFGNDLVGWDVSFSATLVKGF